MERRKKTGHLFFSQVHSKLQLKESEELNQCPWFSIPRYSFGFEALLC